MIIYHLIAITFAYLLDLLIGDPRNWPHPVRWIGSLISVLDKSWNKGVKKKWKGVVMLVSVLLIVFSSAFLVVWISYKIHFIGGIIVEAILIATTIAQRNLKEAALEVYHPLKQQNITEAREKLSYIVGRDTDQLDEGEIVRGTIETVAENTSDGVTAPLFWALIGGAPLAMVYRAVNTCDSMVGYKNERYIDFGFASAKLDDLLNWIPSRITGCLMMLGKKPEQSSLREAWQILYTDAKKHPSPNSGWGEAAVAALLGIQLGGTNYYKGLISNRAKMGRPIVPMKADHILKTNTILARTSLLFLLFLWIGGILIEYAITWF
ncbi:adenosylcobinamide-phosphate synthase CbiB [Fredinandcohnia quinoae]|uniref:Cobalamin biosynthesis protein CobD n=1 Tax=Fredinandcohnia quinoae TaxID=2918902 RepID=A0AAW5E0I3_9BACI|nr:adenosylcobinamide-phosphate synthase CbiB [Fredinandcohnia sp. SECRCQ15]MCH1626416.1 adenosylcobinamide-phosphate synthase CbiB [Fredinandcohnia sp. SECRCQ15]